jgi:phosphoribosylamine--glycine ligase
MIVDGVPQVLEYNCRFGDPETQVLMTRLRGPLAPLLLAAARGELAGDEVAWEAPASLSVVLAASGYPGPYAKGAEITGLDQAARVEGVTVFHAGTVRENERLITAGGRVLSVTAVGATVDEAAERAYRAAELVSFDGKHYRRDIGWRARVTSD